MTVVDLIFASLVGRRAGDAPIIACLYTGHAPPPNCAPMLRSPEPQTGQPLDTSFADHLASALALNPAVHDGAVMLGREDVSGLYRISGWSYRLFPADAAGGKVTNRGSAFNSCLDMSIVSRVDRLYLITRDGICRFEKGSVTQLVYEMLS